MTLKVSGLLNKMTYKIVFAIFDYYVLARDFCIIKLFSLEARFQIPQVFDDHLVETYVLVLYDCMYVCIYVCM